MRMFSKRFSIGFVTSLLKR